MEPLSLNLSFLLALFFGPAPVVAVEHEEDDAFDDVVALIAEGVDGVVGDEEL